MISIVCWMWYDATTPQRAEFKPEHVNQLARMIRRHYPEPHRFICISDRKKELSSDVEWIETPAEAQQMGALRSPEGNRFPSCYRRLWTFSNAARSLGDTVLVLDIDLVIVRDMSPLFVKPEADFVGWRPYRDWGRQLRFGGGIYKLRTGSRVAVWEEFFSAPANSIKTARAAGFRGSDQAWISYKLAKDEPYYGKEAGIYSVRDLDASLRLPDDAVLVQFNGNAKPWHVNRSWVMEHWNTGCTPPALFGTSGKT